MKHILDGDVVVTEQSQIAKNGVRVIVELTKRIDFEDAP